MIHINGPCKCQIYEVSTNFESSKVILTKKGTMPRFPYICNLCGKTFGTLGLKLLSFATLGPTD